MPGQWSHDPVTGSRIDMTVLHDKTTHVLSGTTLSSAQSDQLSLPTLRHQAPLAAHWVHRLGFVFSLLFSFAPVHEISNNVVCATSKASDQPAHTHSLIRAFASRLNIL